MWSTGLLVQFSMFHFALVLGLLCKILTQDPGVLGRAESDPRFTCIADLVEKNEKPQRFCPYCEVRRIDSGWRRKRWDQSGLLSDNLCLLHRIVGSPPAETSYCYE